MIGTVYLIDACLTPVGLLIAMACAGTPFAFLLVLPLLALLAALAADRRRRIQEAVGRLDELTAEHERLDRAIHRIGEAFGSKLDRAGARRHHGAHGGRGARRRATAARRLAAGHGRARRRAPAPALAGRRAARAPSAGALRVDRTATTVAMAQPLTGGARAATTEVLAVARRGAPFTRRRAGAVRLLARQTAVAMENVALHDQLRRQATVDELTGLSNHRRFQEALRARGRRGCAARAGRPRSR